MFVITVLPIKNGFGEAISYFSAREVVAGSLVLVPLRKSEILALVLNSESAEIQKAELRSSNFSLRKIGKIKSKPFLSSQWMNAMKRFAEYFAISEGEAVATLIPKIALENITSQKINSPEDAHQGEVTFFQGDSEERISLYKRVIREEFAKKRSVFLCLSTREEIERARKSYSLGIEKYAFIFRADMTKREFVKNIRTMSKISHPVLIIGTPNFLFLPMRDLGMIILDNENSDSWKTFNRPFVDLRKFVAFFAEESGFKLLSGDLVLSVETLNTQEQNDLSFHNLTLTKMKVVEMKKEIISKELLDLIAEAREKNKGIFIYATRRGLSSTTVCRDCGETVICNNCSSPVVLYKKESRNIFKCHQCGEERSAQEVCKNCGSWRLLPLGVGVEKVAEEVRKAFPQIEITEINSEAGHPKAPFGKIIIGTEMALNYLHSQIDFSAIASIDSLFAIPNFRIREKIFRLLMQIRSITNEKFFVQVRNTELETVNLALSGNILDFYKREIVERKELDYPPFSVFIKITSRGTRLFVEKEMAKLVDLLKNKNLEISYSFFPSSSERFGSQYAMNCVIKIKKDLWPHRELISLLRSLPPHFEIKVDSDNLL